MSGSEDFRSADKVSVTAVETKAPSNALEEVIDFCSQTVQHPEARIRQTGTVLQGIIVGGIKDIPNELINHPLETCGKVAVAGAVKLNIGAAFASEILSITGITIGGGGTILGAEILDSFKRMSSSALDAVYQNADFASQANTNAQAEKILRRGPSF